MGPPEARPPLYAPEMRLAVPFACTLLVACAGAGASGTTTPTPPRPRHVEGHVLYEARHETPTGASQALERRPARFVAVSVIDDDDDVVATTRTDARGRFALESPPSGLRLRVSAEAEYVGTSLAVSPDARGIGVHAFEVPLGAGPMEVVALETSPTGDAGAFHILDTMVRGAERVFEWTGRVLPPVFAYWGRGITSEWSYYHGEQPRGSGRYGIELLGGEAGRQASTDTDEHDEAIILHELGHFVFDVLSTDSSPGGTHPVDVLVEPGLAWEEGRASFFAGAVLGSPLYRDTIGLEPRGELRVNVNMELTGRGPRGIGSEGEVEEILWDLADGLGLPDADGDGVALGPAKLLSLMFEQRELAGAFPCLSTFVGYVVDRGEVSRGAMIEFLARGSHPDSILPPAGTVTWPITLAVPGVANGKIDAVSNPAPSGGEPRPSNGVDAVHVYRVFLASPGYFEVTLRIEGTGNQASRTDLDLELRDIRADLLASSNGESATEVVARHVEPGFYVVVVRDGGGEGSRAGYELRTSLTP